MYVLKPTQKIFFRGNSGLDETLFIYSKEIAPAGMGIFDKEKKGIKKTNEMILYNEEARFYFWGDVISLDYANMKGIFETENFFVIMIQSNCIFTFQKCVMRPEIQEKVKEILALYYKIIGKEEC